MILPCLIIQVSHYFNVLNDLQSVQMKEIVTQLYSATPVFIGSTCREEIFKARQSNVFIYSKMNSILHSAIGTGK